MEMFMKAPLKTVNAQEKVNLPGQMEMFMRAIL